MRNTFEIHSEHADRIKGILLNMMVGMSSKQESSSGTVKKQTAKSGSAKCSDGWKALTIWQGLSLNVNIMQVSEDGIMATKPVFLLHCHQFFFLCCCLVFFDNCT